MFGWFCDEGYKHVEGVSSYYSALRSLLIDGKENESEWSSTA